MQAQAQQQYYSPAEYLELEEKAEFKSEYRDGEIVPMTGGSINHNRIYLNVAAYLKFALKGRNFQVFTSDLRVWIPNYRFYTYPDVFVIQGQPIMQENRTDTVINPTLIVEVLSKSTKNYDQGDKFDYYRSIPGFQEYILIDQYRFYVEQFAKTAENQWLLTEYTRTDAALTLSTVDVQISFSDIYEQVDFNLVEE